MDCLTTILLLLLLTPFASTSTVKFEVYNNCSYTVWAAATPVGGGQRLDTGQSWIINVPNGTKLARIWGRTNCNFDSSGRGSCETGDCGGVLQCTGWGKPPNTLAEFALNQFNNLDFFDISNVDGFNIPMSFAPTRPGADKCHAISCPADIVGQCPDELRVPGGCNNPCTTFGGTQYCCTNGPCGPTDYSKFFKGLCPDAYSYPQDDATSTFTCPGGTTDYRVVFCPKRVNKIKMSYAANIEVLNNCPFTVWAAATPVGGGQRLDQGQNWTINIPASSSQGRVWGRTNCNFDSSGRGSCQTGDCGGVLQCTEWGKPPNTRVEYSLKQLNNLDVFDISLIDGFNIPLSFSPTKPTDKCHAISCTVDLVGQCPVALRDPGGCNNPCTTFQTPEYCCTKNEPCGPTDYSRFFKGLCPDAFSYSRDDATSTFTCPGGTTDYKVVFCP